jgi:putative ABC transport system permease protein
MNTLLLDIRYALRMFMNSPGLTAIAALALGIGANTALFSVLKGVLLNPLAYPEPGQLVALYGNALGSDKVLISYPNFLDWQREAQLFFSMAAYRNQDYLIGGISWPEELLAAMKHAVDMLVPTHAGAAAEGFRDTGNCGERT